MRAFDCVSGDSIFSIVIMICWECSVTGCDMFSRSLMGGFCPGPGRSGILTVSVVVGPSPSSGSKADHV